MHNESESITSLGKGYWQESMTRPVWKVAGITYCKLARLTQWLKFESWNYDVLPSRLGPSWDQSRPAHDVRPSEILMEKRRKMHRFSSNPVRNIPTFAHMSSPYLRSAFNSRPFMNMSSQTKTRNFNALSYPLLDVAASKKVTTASQAQAVETILLPHHPIRCKFHSRNDLGIGSICA